MRFKLAALALLACSLSCSNTESVADKNAQSAPSPSPTPLSHAAEVASDEIDDQLAGDDPDDRAAARQAAREFVASRLPAWSVLGLHTQVFEGKIYRVTADIEQKQKRGRIILVVKKFYPNDAEPYWKADVETKNIKNALHEKADEEMLDDLNVTKDELRAKENP